MVKYIKGDVLNCKATLVAHQVNAFGVMGGGIAAAIWPLLTPESQSAYVERCRHNAKLPVTEWMGSIQILDTKREELKICNLFTQFPAPVDGSFDLTAYHYLRQALDLLRVYAVFNDYDIVGAFSRVYACYIHFAQHSPPFLPESLAALPIVYSKHILYTRIIEANSI